ncbi:MAG TPA: extradiol ring-cleavage dioxygenase [Chloroflexota bacterium]|nr:extradiol ring-cleavage dioxygenase [Chloroflexota bacterium]
MADILGLGLSHFPGFRYLDEEMALRVKQTITSSRVPAELKDPKNWPEVMQREWGSDEGKSFAAEHRRAFVAGMRRLRAGLDDFKPDVAVIFGDDQFENFHDDLVPPFCVYIRDEYETQPFLKARGGPPLPNVWGEPNDKAFHTAGHAQAGRHLARALLGDGFDVAYAYRSLHHEGLGHAFINTILYLDYDRTGWPYPIVPFHVNAYGSSLVRNRGGSANLFQDGESELDPPAPSPRRCFELGQAVARAMRASPWRTVIIGSSSWSHAFLTAKNHYVYPDVASDRRRFEELKAGNYTAWRDLSLEEVEAAGENELLNWLPLAGAMHELRLKPSYCEFLESYLMNSCKCSVLFPPNGVEPC